MAIGGFGVIFFDLGETLVTRVPGAVRAAWVPGAQAALAQLAARGVRLGLISNTTGLSRAQVLDRLPTDFQFNQFESGLVILSSETAPQTPLTHSPSREGERRGVINCMENGYQPPSPRGNLMVYMWRKYSGSWKNKTSKRSVFTARMYSFYVNLTVLAVAGLGLSVSFSSSGRRGPMELQTMEAADALQRVALSSLCPDATTKGSHTMTQSVVPTFEMR